MEMARRYPTVGGIAAWRIPCLFGPCALAAELVGEWMIAGVIVVVAATMWWVERALIIEVSSTGLAWGLVVGGRFLGTARVIPWRSVEEVATSWRHENDFTALDTVVRGLNGEEVRFGTRMGLGAYRALLATIDRHTLGARRTGLTGQFLAEPPVSTRRMVRGFAAALSTLVFLAILAFVAWA